MITDNEVYVIGGRDGPLNTDTHVDTTHRLDMKNPAGLQPVSASLLKGKCNL